MVAEMVVRWDGLNGQINTKKLKKKDQGDD